MTFELKPFQKEAVAKMTRFLKERGCVYNACEPGLGKTCQTISTIEEFKFKDVLIICPSVVKYVWAEELKKWAKRSLFYQVVNSGKEPISFGQLEDLRVTIVSYDLAVKKVKEISAYTWDCLVCDEADMLKNHKTSRAKVVLGSIWFKAKYKICLSGTPFVATVADCWPVFSRMAPEDFGDYWKFIYTYCNVSNTPWGKKIHGIRQPEKLRKIINDKFFFRYLKKSVLPELPDRIFQKIPLGPELAVKISKEELVEHEKYLVLLKDSYIKGVPLKAAPPKSIATTRREQGLLKIPAIREFCQNLLDKDIPLILFCWHTEIIKKLWEELKQYNPVVIMGETSAKDRASAVEAFQRGSTNLYLSNIQSGAVGVTLTRSSTVVLGELSYSPRDIEQAVSRAHRYGAKDTVNIYYFSVLNSIDERIAEIVMEKSASFNKVLQ